MLHARFAAAAAVLFAASAQAQPGSAPSPRDPADPQAAAPPVVHQSPFAGYRGFSGEGPRPWRDVNDEVGRIGGWKAYAREVYEAQEAAKAATPPRDGAPSPANGRAK